MRQLVDLADGRRAAKTWLPEDDRDVTNGLVIALSSDWVDRPGRYPHCIRHGAMNRVDQHRSIWRCSEFRCGVGAEIVEVRPGLDQREAEARAVNRRFAELYDGLEQHMAAVRRANRNLGGV